jgi:hypothetical protein
MDRAAFDIYIETQLAPTLQAGDVVILDNLKVHESAKGGGPGCLNRFSASISGASAGVRLPCGRAAG